MVQPDPAGPDVSEAASTVSVERWIGAGLRPEGPAGLAISVSAVLDACELLLAGRGIISGEAGHPVRN